LRQDLLGRASEHEVSYTAPIMLACPFGFRRRGSEVRLVLENDLAGASPIASLSRVVARANDWAGKIATDELRTMADLTRYSGLTKPYIRQVLRSCVLSPSLTSAILKGEHSPDLTVTRLTRGLPFDWLEQHLDPGPKDLSTSRPATSAVTETLINVTD
jgi:hypothetical protein